MSHASCETDPCQLCKRRAAEHVVACDDCRAGIRLVKRKLRNGNEVTSIEKCDVCLLFETNADATAAVEVLIDMLDVEYASADGTVADAMDRILDLVKSAAELRENIRQSEAEDSTADAVDQIRADVDSHQLLMIKLRCDGWCSHTGTVCMIDRKGFVYCEPCGVRRRASGIPCRKLSSGELRQLEQSQPLRSY